MIKNERFIPAFSYRWLTPAYDTLLRWIMPETMLKRRLVDQARVGPGQDVLDLGSGTGTLTIMLKQAQPDAEVVGLDVDTEVLTISRAKAAAAGVQVAFEHGLAYRLPYPDHSFDRVLSSLMFHHLTAEQKGRALKEAFRILRPGGELHLLDFGRPHNALAWVISLITRQFEEMTDNIAGRLPDMLRRVGFVDIEETSRHMALVGTLSLYRGRKPA